MASKSIIRAVALKSLNDNINKKYQIKNVTITENTVTNVLPDAEFDALSQVNITTNIDVKDNYQEKTINITSNGTTNIIPDSTYDALSEVTVVANIPTTNLEINDASYLFYQGARVKQYNNMLPFFKNITNMTHMFDGWNYFDTGKIDTSLLDTSKVTDMSYMFANIRLNDPNDPIVKVNNFDTSNVTNMNHMFYNLTCTYIPGLSELNTSKVTDMSYMFYNCSANELNVSNFDTSNVTNMSYMFYNCSANELDVSDFNTSNVTNMSYMFQHCDATSINSSNLDASNVTDMSFMFAYCDKIDNININGFKTSKATNMNNMFRNCSFKSLDVSSLDTSNVTNMSYMFAYTSNLLKLDISSFSSDSLTSTSSMFINSWLSILIINNQNLFKITSVSTFQGARLTWADDGGIYVPDDMVETYKSATNWSNYADKIKGISELPQEV